YADRVGERERRGVGSESDAERLVLPHPIERSGLCLGQRERRRRKRQGPELASDRNHARFPWPRRLHRGKAGAQNPDGPGEGALIAEADANGQSRSPTEGRGAKSSASEAGVPAAKDVR